MLTLFAGDIFTDDAVRNIAYMAVGSLVFAGLALGLIIYVIGKVAQKFRGSTGKDLFSLKKSLAIGLLTAAAFGVVFLVAS